jgi:transcriptional regulator GlxA family with amidase domain
MKPVVEYLASLGLGGSSTGEQKDGIRQSLRGDLKWILTVCTGSEILARTGALDGKRATTNKRAFNQASTSDQTHMCALDSDVCTKVKEKHLKVNWVAKGRWVVDGDIWTSSGISAGIDLTFAWISEVFGEETAQYVADRSEYERNTEPENDRFTERWGAV